MAAIKLIFCLALTAVLLTSIGVHGFGFWNPFGGGDQEVSDDVAKKGSVGDDKQQSLSRDKRQGLEVKREEYEDEEEEETAEEEEYEENADNSQMIDEGEGEDDEEYDEEEEEEEEEEEGGNGSEDDGKSPAGGSTRAVCYDNYPKNYWKACSVTCPTWKTRGACWKKWSQVLTGTCKTNIPNWHRNRRVHQYCTPTCGTCKNGNTWSSYSAYSSCSKTCGGGTKTRTKTCSWWGGGSVCPCPSGSTCSSAASTTTCASTGTGSAAKGSCTATFSASCNTNCCPVNGNWATWTSYPACPVTCGGYNQTRTRTCNDPPVSCSGTDCAASGTFPLSLTTDGLSQRMETDMQDCATTLCPIDGNWGAWGNWTTCSVSCGGANQTRVRVCDDPPPQHGGVNCTLNGTFSESSDANGTISEEATRICNDNLCPIHGMWGDWSAWSNCTETCGGGEQTRNRTCDSPEPNAVGDNCTVNGNHADSETASQLCNVHVCPEASNAFCQPPSTDYGEGLGRCGPYWGDTRCNAYLKKDAMFCNILSGMCHNDTQAKIDQGNDAYDWIPELGCKLPCGNQTSTYAKDINLCAATGGTHYGRLSAQACWEACTGHHVGCNGVMVGGIVFKKGTCGCVPVNHLRACSTNINANDTSITDDDYEYFEPGGSNCVITG